MKIYVVSTTEEHYDVSYDETWGVFSSRENAEAAMKLRGKEEWNEVEEMEVDSLERFQPKPKSVYKDACYAEVLIIGDVLDRSGTKPVAEDWEEGVVVHASDWNPHRHHVSATSFASVEHAIELAREARLKWIKEHEGKLDYDPNWHLKDRFS